MSSDARRRDFKKGLDAEGSRRRREQASVEIRKAKKEDSLAKRRNLSVAAAFDAAASEVSDAKSIGSEVARPKYTAADIPALLQGLGSTSLPEVLQSIQGFRRLLSSEKHPCVDEVIASGAVNIFVQMLTAVDHPELQFEAAWSLTNIASTDRTKVVVDEGAVPHLVQLLMSPNANVREQSAWCLGNVAGDGPALRDMILQHNALEGLLLNIQNPDNPSLLRNCTWTLSNFCRGKPQPPLEILRPALQALGHLVQTTNDKEVLTDAIWALSYISDGDNARIQAVLDLGIAPFLVQALAHDSATVLTPVLRTVGNIVTGDEAQTQAILNAGVLNYVNQLLMNPRKNIRKEVCWMLSNIAAGTPQQVQALMSASEIIPHVLQQLSEAEWDVQKEAAWVMSNIVTPQNTAHVQQLVEYGLIKPMCKLLSVHDSKIILLALETIDVVLKVGISTNAEYNIMVDEAGGIDALEELQNHQNHNVYQKAIAIAEKYFGTEDEESENLQPTVQGGTYTFGVAAKGSSTFSGFGQQNGAFSGFNFKADNPIRL